FVPSPSSLRVTVFSPSRKSPLWGPLPRSNLISPRWDHPPPAGLAQNLAGRPECWVCSACAEHCPATLIIGDERENTKPRSPSAVLEQLFSPWHRSQQSSLGECIEVSGKSGCERFAVDQGADLDVPRLGRLCEIRRCQLGQLAGRRTARA